MHLNFGGDELSSRDEPIRERSIPAFVAIARADVAKTGVNGHATVNIDGQLLQLPTRISDSLPQGTIGLPAGFAGIPFLADGVVAHVTGDGAGLNDRKRVGEGTGGGVRDDYGGRRRIKKKKQK